MYIRILTRSGDALIYSSKVSSLRDDSDVNALGYWQNPQHLAALPTYVPQYTA